MLNNHKSSNNVNVGGKMSEQGADKVGLIQAVALAFLAICLGVAVLIVAIKF